MGARAARREEESRVHVGQVNAQNGICLKIVHQSVDDARPDLGTVHPVNGTRRERRLKRQ
jgi:hypothetical protein